jgi:D-beta-D-heptose 7-phosphate kinase/D-beta-D-heptose 1-phosphate adenosyltransferase
MKERKIKKLSELKIMLNKLKKKKKKVVFTNGCFDLLHYGHIQYLKKAKALGDILVVGLNSDSSVKKLKGTGRPLVPEKERAEILSALEFVDYVTIFSEETPANLIRQVKPDILVKGGDYSLDEIVGRDFVQSCGGKVVTIPLVKGKSTTGLIRKIKNSLRRS